MPQTASQRFVIAGIPDWEAPSRGSPDTAPLIPVPGSSEGAVDGNCTLTGGDTLPFRRYIVSHFIAYASGPSDVIEELHELVVLDDNVHCPLII